MRNSYQGGVDAGITYTEEDFVRERQASCRHEWKPWIYTERDGGWLLILPGMRCSSCHNEMMCLDGGLYPETRFEKMFGMSFQDFLNKNDEAVERELSAKAPKNARRVATRTECSRIYDFSRQL